MDPYDIAVKKNLRWDVMRDGGDLPILFDHATDYQIDLLSCQLMGDGMKRGKPKKHYIAHFVKRVGSCASVGIVGIKSPDWY